MIHLFIKTMSIFKAQNQITIHHCIYGVGNTCFLGCLTMLETLISC